MRFTCHFAFNDDIYFNFKIDKYLQKRENGKNRRENSLISHRRCLLGRVLEARTTDSKIRQFTSLIFRLKIILWIMIDFFARRNSCPKLFWQFYSNWQWNWLNELEIIKHDHPAMSVPAWSRISAGKIGDEMIAWFRSARVNLRRVGW